MGLGEGGERGAGEKVWYDEYGGGVECKGGDGGWKVGRLWKRPVAGITGAGPSFQAISDMPPPYARGLLRAG